MDFMFYGVPTLMIVVVVGVAVFVIRRALRIRRAWNSGLTAEARCLRTYTTTSGGSGDSSVSTTLHHVYEFVARDGRTVRFEEPNGSGTILEGDYVTVFYSEGPRINATAHRPSPLRNGLALAGILGFLGMFVVFCVGFMVTYSQVFEPIDDMFFGGDSGYSDTDSGTVDGFPEGWEVTTESP
ncbi:hypothetical protein ADL01_38680 [Streptomyces sp. NRRL WC-3618]|uniref:DUF3592 domain-containing protein n=1 Tax=Streptomyces sp. NRRL WC-3618 TaxID=1519490 RepID=UPI0006AF8305|nr:DUF3592 domain-containing protein [Streptomyces sp. NRRL WC-3618]KOV57995.1 hypothetical protein ADL01_38680 [Streptomyces sp. NRRL WC-3618]